MLCVYIYILATILQETFPKWGNLPASCRRLSQGWETFLQVAGDFPKVGIPSCKLQETFPRLGFLPASCRRLSQGWDFFLQVAGDFPKVGIPSCKSQETFPTLGFLPRQPGKLSQKRENVDIKNCAEIIY
jgi:hypothetical protein